MVSAREDGVNQEAARRDVREVARRLNSALGSTLVALLAGATDLTLADDWARAGGAMPSAETVQRLRFAYERWREISDAEGGEIARAWFIGTNPWLEDDTPVNAIRRYQLAEVAAAARALIDDSFSG